MPYRIRPMRREDIPQVNAIDREAFPSQWPAPNYQHELELQLAHYVVILDESHPSPESGRNHPGGWLSRLRRLFARDSAGSSASPGQFVAGFAGIWVLADEAHVTNIAVRREYQGRGLGKQLLIAIVETANRLNASFLTLEVRASNTSAQQLYRKFGFRETGRRKGYYLDNREDAVLMSTESLTSTSFQEKYQQLRQRLR
ncbi:MAG: ribosomal protein S18-alanine N-acetyltransferase [Chloroflexota bacterium]